MHTDHPFTEKQDVFQLPDFAAGPYSVICDFDGTVTPFDVTDAILERFARPAWKTIEDEWVRGAISARQCMERQIPLIEAPLERLDAFLDTVPVTGGFVEFVRYSRSKGIPLGIVSDGMDYPIKRILNRHGLRHVPVVANRMVYREGAYRLEFPYGREGCASGVCKCGVAEAVSGDGKTLLIGDGLSDCCLARSASFTLARQGKAVVLVLHDLPLALSTADRLAVLDGGRLLAVDGPEALCADGILNSVFGIELGRVMTDRGWRYYYL